MGGGIAGLAAAYELHTRRVPFVLFERTAHFGGVIFTDRRDGYTIEAGPDSLLTQKPAAIALCQELGLAGRLIPTKTPRTAYILRDGVLHPLPEGSVVGLPTRIAPLLTTNLFSWSGKIRMALELVLPRKRLAPDADESIGSFIGRRFGREAVTYLAEPLLAGIHSGDVDRLSIRSLFPRLLEAEQRHGSVLGAFRRLSSDRDPNGVFRSLPGGIGELVDALVGVLNGPCLRRGIAVAALGGAGPFDLNLSTGSAIRARSVILATPAYVTADLLEPADPELGRLCRSISYVSVATVALAYPRTAIKHPLLGSGFVVPRAEGRRILAASWLSAKWPNRAPEGIALLRAFMGGTRDPDVQTRTDIAIVSAAHEELAEILNIKGAPILQRLYRWPLVGAQHEVGHLQKVAAIEARLAHRPGLYLTGSGFRGTGIPDCIADGRAVAKKIISDFRFQMSD